MQVYGRARSAPDIAHADVAADLAALPVLADRRYKHIGYNIECTITYCIVHYMLYVCVYACVHIYIYVYMTI